MIGDDFVMYLEVRDLEVKIGNFKLGHVDLSVDKGNKGDRKRI